SEELRGRPKVRYGKRKRPEPHENGHLREVQGAYASRTAPQTKICLLRKHWSALPIPNIPNNGPRMTLIDRISADLYWFIRENPLDQRHPRPITCQSSQFDDRTMPWTLANPNHSFLNHQSFSCDVFDNIQMAVKIGINHIL